MTTFFDGLDQLALNTSYDVELLARALSKLTPEQGSISYAIIIDHYIRVDGQSLTEYSAKTKRNLNLPYDGKTLANSKGPFYECNTLPSVVKQKLAAYCRMIGVM